MTGRGICAGVVTLALAVALAFAMADGAEAKGKSRKSGKSERRSEKSLRSDKSGKSVKSGKSGKSCKSGKSGCTEPPPPPACEPGQVPDVSAVILGLGDVSIFAGPCANEVYVHPGSQPGTIRISVPAGHSLNGVAGPTSVETPVVGPVHVDLGGGDDMLRIEFVDLPGNLSIDMGDGSNFVRLFDSDVGGTLEVVGGDDVDTFSATALRVAGSIALDLGGGDNGATIDAFAGDAMTVLTGGGRDSVGLFDGSGAAGDVFIDVGGGDDGVRLALGTTAGGNLTVTTGAGEDLVDVGPCATVGLDATFDTGDDADGVVLAGLGVGGALTVLTGGGDDQVAIGPSTSPACDTLVVGDTTIRLGEGEDGLSVGTLIPGTGTTTFSGGFLADAGAGLDQRIAGLDVIHLGPVAYVDFEAVATP